MKFWYRLRVYLLGVGLGVGLVFVFFKDRTSVLSSWTPNQRILQELQQKDMLSLPRWKCYTYCWGVDREASFFSDGDVQFSESKPQANPREYKVYFDINEEKHVSMTFHVLDSTVRIVKAQTLDFTSSCSCDSVSEIKYPEPQMK